MSLTTSNDLRAQLAQLLEVNRLELVDGYQRVLREFLFNGRSTMRPNMLRQIATDEVEAIHNFLRQPQPQVVERGIQLHQSGLSEQPLLRLGQVTRQFFVKHLENGQIAPALAVIDSYQEQVVQGFIHSLETAVFNVQEQTRHAFERVVNRENRKSRYGE